MKPNQVLLAHPTGNQFFRHLASGLDRRRQLGGAATCIKWPLSLSVALRPVLPRDLMATLERRSFPEAWGGKIMIRPWKETKRLLTHRSSVDDVYDDFDRWLSRRLPQLKAKLGLGGVYNYEDGAEQTFLAARNLGLECAYDLPITYWETTRKLLAEEAQRLPQWAETLGGGIADPDHKLHKKTRELQLATKVVCPSQFVVDSLPSWARSKTIVLAPFGSPFRLDLAAGFAPKASTTKLRVLFVGSMGQRKGLADLFSAIRLLDRGDIELVVLGTLQAPMQFYRNQLSDFIYEPGRPHHKVLQLMKTCDVLCLPSIIEGRALVMQEAMSQGLPIVITPNTGGSDLINEGETGFLVPIRRPDLLAARLAWLADNPRLMPAMKQAAMAKAQEYSWRAYSDRIADALLAA